MKIAVEGCCHGELDAIYDHIRTLESQNKYKVDLLLICGDFQAVRNLADLQCMAVPNKYKTLGGFHKYYAGKKTAPVLTVVIGGNHEASNYMWELYHGGWLAPNIYFLGHAGCIKVNGVRIAGASGIFKGHDFRKGNHERLPYTSNSLRSIYHIREFNVRRLSLLSQPTIFVSHDWPQSIEHHGNLKNLLSRKTFLRSDVESGNLGSPPMMGLLQTLKPAWWFSAHLHVKYEATVTHGPQSEQIEDSKVQKVENPDEIVIDTDDLDIAAESTMSEPGSATASSTKQNPDEIILDDEEITVEAPAAPVSVTRISKPPTKTRSSTRFLALDKCLPGRKFLEVIDFPTDSESRSASVPLVLEFDPEWLAITRAFNRYFSTRYSQLPFPEENEARRAVSDALQWVVENLQKNDPSRALPISDVEVFAPTAPPPPPSSPPNQKVKESEPQPPAYSNPQTEAFCRMLDITNKINPGCLLSGGDDGE